MNGISVVIPAFNEGRRLGRTLARVADYLGRNGWDFELIVVDDGSRDDTASVASGFAAGNPSVRVLVNEMNRGKGYSVRRGMLEAARPLRLFCDADLATPIEELEKLLPWISAGYDVVIGSRALPDSSVERRQPAIRELMGKTFGRIVRRAFDLDVNDTQCGFKLFTERAATALFGAQTLDRFTFDVELLLLARRFGFRVMETGIRWRNDPDTRVDLIATPLQMIGELIALRRGHRGE